MNAAISPGVLAAATAQSRERKALVAAPDILVMPGAYDVISSQLLQHLGCKAMQGTSGGIAAADGYADGEVGLDHMKEYTCGKQFLLISSNHSGSVKSISRADFSPKIQRIAVAPRPGKSVVSIQRGGEEFLPIYVLCHVSRSSEVIARTDTLNVTGAMARAVDVLVHADGEKGYGDAEETAWLVRACIGRGVAGMNLKDSAHPGPSGERRLVPIESHLEKIRVVVSTRSGLGSACFLNARVDAFCPMFGNHSERHCTSDIR